MSVLIALFSLLPLDLCKIGGLMQDNDRSLALVLSDPDRMDVCLVDQAGPLFPWEVPCRLRVSAGNALPSPPEPSAGPARLASLT